MQTLLDRWYAAVRGGDLVAFADITTDDVVLYWNANPAVLPWAGSHRGRDTVWAFFKTLAASIEVVGVTVVDTIATPDAMIVILDGQWRARATGKLIAARACNVFRVRDGKICAYEVYNDSERFVAALAP